MAILSNVDVSIQACVLQNGRLLEMAVYMGNYEYQHQMTHLWSDIIQRSRKVHLS